MWQGADELAALLEERSRRDAGRDLLSFMRYCWWNPSKFIVGRHTRAICARLTRAVEDFRRGKSTYLIVKVPFRHGKSDMCSVALPAYFLGRCADMQPSVILTGYGTDLVTEFSHKSREFIVAREPYQRVFPGVEPGTGNAAKWKVAGSIGNVTAVGLGGSITGKGGNLIVLDDYCKSRAEAVSKARRDKVWDAFRNDVFTRQNSPAAIVLVVATPWHVDDLIGRIKAEMADTPEFPRFEEMSFPARKFGPGGWDYLFPEFKTPEWYDTQRAVLGRQAAALLDCEPQIEGGNRFNPDNCQIHTTLDGWPKVREVRAWDLASTTAERSGDDPDWTWGVRGCVTRKKVEGVGVIHELWIRSMVCCQKDAPARNALIQQTAMADGPAVRQAVEAFGAYRDAYTELRAALSGIAIVSRSAMTGDKSAKAAPMEPIFEAGNVHVFMPGCRAAWDQWRTDFLTFPDGAHDDAVDATAIMYHEGLGGGSQMVF